MPAARAMASAVWRLSPVSITTSSPSRRSSATASAEPGLSVSAIPRTATARPSIATRTGLRPCAARASAASSKRPRIDAGRLEEPGTPDANRRPVHGRIDPLPGRGFEAIDRRELEPALVADVAHERVAEGVLRPELGCGRQRQQPVLVRCAGDANDVGDPRPALGQRAGLVENDRLDATESLEGLGVAEEDPGLGALAGSHHDRRRRGQARARTGRR